MAFPEIDTSYWKTKDPDWMAARKAEWPRIQLMLKASKPSKALSAIKQYYLKGTMPDWDKFRDWDNPDRHLDLFLFIWLHPSWDEAVLTPLRDAYIASDLIVVGDINQGIGNFLGWSTVMACQDPTGRENEWGYILHTDGHNELLFKVLMGDLSKTRYELEFIDRGLGREKVIYDLPQSSLHSIHTMGTWLCIKTMLPFNNDMLFQYDLPLDWWYQSCTKDERFFDRDVYGKGQKPLIEKALWRIHHFDTGKEGDTCRTRFVTKMRKILDERPFIKDIKTMWEKVKAGEVQVEDPWER